MNTQLPIGFARIPPQQFQTMRGLRKYIMGIKCYNEWGYYYVRRSGRFCDAKALQIMFGDEVMAMLDEQRLIKPVTLPPEVMDDDVFPPTEYKKIERFESAKAKYNPMPMEEGFFAKLNFVKIYKQRSMEKKRWKRKEKLLTEWRADDKSDDEIVLLLKEEGLLDVENRSLIGKEEFADFNDKSASKPLKQHSVFQRLLVERPQIYEKFKDLEWFTPREVGIMKEYGQIGLVKLDERGQIVVDYKTDPLVVNENGVPRGIPPPKREREPDYKKMSQEELHEIYEGDYPITVPEKGNFLRMKPEKEEEKRRATVMRFIEWKRDLDERASNQIRKMKIREMMELGDEEAMAMEEERIAREMSGGGYAMSSHAILEKYEREGLIQEEFEINKTKKKKGPKYWKRYLGNTFRPRRSSTKRWNNMWDKRMVLDRKTKKRGRYLGKSIKRT